MRELCRSTHFRCSSHFCRRDLKEAESLHSSELYCENSKEALFGIGLGLERKSSSWVSILWDSDLQDENSEIEYLCAKIMSLMNDEALGRSAVSWIVRERKGLILGRNGWKIMRQIASNSRCIVC